MIITDIACLRDSVFMMSSQMAFLHDTMSQCLNGIISTDLQKLKDWHLVIAVLGVTAVGIVLLVTRSALLPKQPKLIEDRQDSEGRTVRAEIHRHAFKRCSITVTSED